MKARAGISELDALFVGLIPNTETFEILRGLLAMLSQEHYAAQGAAARDARLGRHRRRARS